MRTLLLADDNITVQRVIALTFAGESIQVVTVADGHQAIEKMAAHQPDIVLAGTTLPNVNGYELARFMRGRSELQMVPVLLLAGAFENVDEASLASSGADGILEKPVEPTTLINRVKELLGLKSEEKPVSTGRLVTPAAPADRNRPSAAPRSVTSAHPQPSNPPPGTPAKQAPGSGPRPMANSTSQSADYLDTLDAAFDSLDQQLSGGAPVAKTPPNHPGPLGQVAGAVDPRSSGRVSSTTNVAAGNPVFEVDDEWFNAAETKARADARAADRQIAEDLRDPEFRAPADPAPSSPVFEVDDTWFAADNTARARKALDQERLAHEMGVHEVAFPVAAKPQEPPSTLHPVPPATIAPIDPLPHVVREFEALLAPGPGERQPAPQPEIKLVAPEITGEMLDQIASRVADRLTAGAFGESLKEAMAATMRETVRAVVTETSERLVRDTASSVVAETSERIVRDSVHKIVAETSERIVRESVHTVVSEASERVLRDAVPSLVAETSERLIRDAAPGVVADTSERIVRDSVQGIVTEAAERAVRDTVHTAVAEASARAVRDAVPAVVAETSERLIRDTMPAVIAETSERMVRDMVAGVVVEASERLIREAVPSAVSNASERVVRENLRNVVLETSERLVREEIERIKSRNLDKA